MSDHASWYMVASPEGFGHIMARCTVSYHDHLRSRIMFYGHRSWSIYGHVSWPMITSHAVWWCTMIYDHASRYWGPSPVYDHQAFSHSILSPGDVPRAHALSAQAPKAHAPDAHSGIPSWRAEVSPRRRRLFPWRYWLLCVVDIGTWFLKTSSLNNRCWGKKRILDQLFVPQAFRNHGMLMEILQEGSILNNCEGSPTEIHEHPIFNWNPCSSGGVPPFPVYDHLTFPRPPVYVHHAIR